MKAEKKPRPISSGQQIDKYLNRPRHIVRTRAHVFFFVFFLGRGIYQINILFILFLLLIIIFSIKKYKIQMENGYLGCLSHSCVVIGQKGAQHF